MSTELKKVKGKVPGKPERSGSILTQKKRDFVHAYLATAPFYNARKAADMAGYKGVGDAAHNILKDPAVELYLNEFRERSRMSAQVTHEDIIRQVTRIAFFDIRTLYNEDGNLKPINKLDDIAAAAIASIEADEYKIGNELYSVNRKVKIKDQLKALEMLRDMLGFKPAEKKSIYDAEGNLLGTQVTENANEDKIIFEDHSQKLTITAPK